MSGVSSSDCTKPLVCVLACSGCSAAGEPDHTARRLQQMGAAKMSCLAGVGGRISSITATVRSASGILMIDGCQLECGANALRNAGFTGFKQPKSTNSTCANMIPARWTRRQRHGLPKRRYGC
jgi:uncharacterized metal-binding protein